MLNMDLEYNKGILFVRLKGNLNRKSSYKLNNYLVPVLLKHKIRYLVYNLYELSDIDEAGVDAMLNTKCAIKANKGKICLCEVSKSLEQILKRLKIKSVSNERKVFDLIRV
ncbi:MAG: STAS domain-containing protein [Bacilli bacterium]|nr:STAS domain-containing protein [Bacilli bacterium]